MLLGHHIPPTSDDAPGLHVLHLSYIQEPESVNIQVKTHLNCVRVKVLMLGHYSVYFYLELMPKIHLVHILGTCLLNSSTNISNYCSDSKYILNLDQ